MTYILSILAALVTTTKTWWGVMLIGMCTLLSPITHILYAMLFLIVVDTITGIIASYYRDNVTFKLFSRESWRHIRSSRLTRTLNKMLAYLLLVISAFIIDVILIQNSYQIFVSIISGAIALRELVSIIENVEDIVGGGIVRIIKSILNKGILGASVSSLPKQKKKKRK